MHTHTKSEVNPNTQSYTILLSRILKRQQRVFEKHWRLTIDITMHGNMYVILYVCELIQVRVFVNKHTYTHINASNWSARPYIHTYIHIFTYTNIHIHAYIHICSIHTYMHYILSYTYTYMNIQP